MNSGRAPGRGAVGDRFAQGKSVRSGRLEPKALGPGGEQLHPVAQIRPSESVEIEFQHSLIRKRRAFLLRRSRVEEASGDYYDQCNPADKSSRHFPRP